MIQKTNFIDACHNIQAIIPLSQSQYFALHNADIDTNIRAFFFQFFAVANAVLESIFCNLCTKNSPHHAQD